MSAVAKAPFNKPALSVVDQLNLLQKRGLLVADPAAAQAHLHLIGYYRLSGYTLPFQQGGPGLNRHYFQPGTTFEAVYDRYVFDRKLRLLVMDAIERIEVALRAELSNSVAIKHGPHWYTTAMPFGKAIGARHPELIADIKRQLGIEPYELSRRQIFIKHYMDTYCDPELPPCWMVFEAISFGTVSRIFECLGHSERQQISSYFGQLPPNLTSWLHSISYVRNLCAHHSRLWNRTFTIKPVIPHAHKADLSPNDRLYAQLVIMQLLMKKVSPGSQWSQRLMLLLDEHPSVPSVNMGFPPDWRTKPLWAPHAPVRAPAHVLSPSPASGTLTLGKR